MEDRITVRFPKGTRHQIKIASAIADISMNAWITQTILQKLKEKKNESKGHDWIEDRKFDCNKTRRTTRNN